MGTGTTCRQVFLFLKGKMNSKNVIGMRFGRLVVLEKSPSVSSGNKTYSMYKCKCDCGKLKNVRRDGLLSGNTKSCGCLSREILSLKTIMRCTKHNLSSHPLYRIWKGMKRRCNNPNDKSYKNYGGRGITICKEWQDDFKSFYEWALNNGYSYQKLANGINKLTIDRINTDGNYEPLNCRWVTQKEQMRNVKYNKLYKVDGKIITEAEVCEKHNVHVATFRARIKKGMSVEDALNTPVRKRSVL